MEVRYASKISVFAYKIALCDKPEDDKRGLTEEGIFFFLSDFKIACRWKLIRKSAAQFSRNSF
jgi:hypothetical protein